MLSFVTAQKASEVFGTRLPTFKTFSGLLVLEFHPTIPSEIVEVTSLFVLKAINTFLRSSPVALTSAAVPSTSRVVVVCMY
jgi:hypothetical protein